MKEMDPPEQKLKKFKLEVNEDWGKDLLICEIQIWCKWDRILPLKIEEETLSKLRQGFQQKCP